MCSWRKWDAFFSLVSKTRQYSREFSRIEFSPSQTFPPESQVFVVRQANDTSSAAVWLFVAEIPCSSTVDGTVSCHLLDAGRVTMEAFAHAPSKASELIWVARRNKAHNPESKVTLARKKWGLGLIAPGDSVVQLTWFGKEFCYRGQKCYACPLTTWLGASTTPE